MKSTGELKVAKSNAFIIAEVVTDDEGRCSYLPICVCLSFDSAVQEAQHLVLEIVGKQNSRWRNFEFSWNTDPDDKDVEILSYTHEIVQYKKYIDALGRVVIVPDQLEDIERTGRKSAYAIIKVRMLNHVEELING
jgi:hypothetical protein